MHRQDIGEVKKRVWGGDQRLRPNRSKPEESGDIQSSISNLVESDLEEVKYLKYLIMFELREPIEENVRKVFEIEKERRSKGITFLDDATVFPEHQFLSEEKRFMIVETDDPMRIAKWEVDYMTVLKYKVIPIIESTKINELWKDR
jgi:hypothetical protein